MVLGAVGKKCRVLSAVPLGALFPSAPTGQCIVRECASNSAPFYVPLSKLSKKLLAIVNRISPPLTAFRKAAVARKR